MRLLNLSVSQLLWVFFATNLLGKLRTSRLFLRWLASNRLKYYQVPSNDELRKLQFSKKQEKSDSKHQRNHHHQRSSKESFPEPGDAPSLRNANEFKIRASDLIKLDLVKEDVRLNTLDSAPYSDELEWLVDFAVMSLISFVLIQVLFHFSPRSNEYNFSLVWIVLVILQCFMALLKLTAIYFKTKLAAGERSVCVVSAIIFLLFATIVLNTSDNYLEMKIDESLRLLYHGPTSGGSLLDPDEIETAIPSSNESLIRMAAKLVLALLCSLVGVALTFPGFRFGQMQEGIMSSTAGSTLERIICTFNLISPFLVTCLWIPKISRHPLKRQELMILNDENFNTIRLYFLVSTNVFRFALVPRYLGSFLESAVSSRIAQIRRKGGFTTNKSIRISIASLNNFTNVVCIQYVSPAIICLFSSIMFASISSGDTALTQFEQESAKRFATLRYLFGSDQQAIIESAEDLMFNIQRLISSELVTNSLGFLTWWTHFAWSCTSVLGFGYHKYFMH